MDLFKARDSKDDLDILDGKFETEYKNYNFSNHWLLKTSKPVFVHVPANFTNHDWCWKA